MDKLKYLLVVFVLIIFQATNAQETVELDETVFVHTNAVTFVTGEVLYYKLYCLKASDRTPSDISKVGYVELVDSNQKSVFKTKIKLDNATGKGDYFIPTTLKTGSYKLIGYTNWMLNKPVPDLFQLDVVIINPYISSNNKDIGNNSNTSETSIKKEANNIEKRVNFSKRIKFKLLKNKFTNRELVQLEVEILDEVFNDGNYSLSVRKVDNLSFAHTITATEFTSNESSSVMKLDTKANNVILPEIRGEIVSGTIKSKAGTDKIENITIALSATGKSFEFKL